MPWRFLLASCLCFIVAMWFGGFAYVMLWPMLSAVIVFLAYVFDIPQFLGKRPNGAFFPVALLVLLPYLAYSEAIWRLLRLWADDPYHSLDEKVTFGRRVQQNELPDGIDVVVDLTSELIECGWSERYLYLSFPMLDGHAARISDTVQLINFINSHPGRVYVHCAEGRGRTGFIAGALLLLNGVASSPEDAVQLCTTKRSVIKLSRAQHHRLSLLHKTVQTSM